MDAGCGPSQVTAPAVALGANRGCGQEQLLLSPALTLRDCLEMLQGRFPGCTADGMARDFTPSRQPDRVISSSGFLLAGTSAVLPLPAPGSRWIRERNEMNDYSWRPQAQSSAWSSGLWLQERS